MNTVLDGRLMTSREKVHDLLIEKLSLPAYYGRNLDALYDLLTSYPENLEITLSHTSVMLANLGEYGNVFLETLLEASREHPNVSVTFGSEIIENNS